MRSSPRSPPAAIITAALALYAGALNAGGTVEKSPNVKAPSLSALSYVARLERQQPSSVPAALAFLSDAPAQKWLAENRPRDYPTMAWKASVLADWAETLRLNRENALGIRDAVLARAYEDWLADDPSALMAFVEKDAVLSQQRDVIALGLLDWNALSDSIREALLNAGVQADSWATMRVGQRYLLAREILAVWQRPVISAAPGTAEYVQQHEAALAAVGILLEREEIKARREHIEVAVGLARAKEAIAGIKDKTAASLYASAQSAASLDEAHQRLDDLFDHLWPRSDKPRTSQADMHMTGKEMRTISKALLPALAAEFHGTAVGEEFLEFIAHNGIHFQLAASGHNASSAGWYSEGVVRFTLRTLAHAMAELGISKQSIMTDPDALKQVAAVLAPCLAHELTHARQDIEIHKTYPAIQPHGHSLANEAEAYAVQEVFRRQKRASDPQRYARLYAITDSLVLNLHGDPKEFEKILANRNSYYGRPTLARSTARIIKQGVDEDRDIDAITRVLTLRRRLPADSRQKLKKSTQELRRWRDQSAKAGWDALSQALSMFNYFTTHLARYYAQLRAEPAAPPGS